MMDLETQRIGEGGIAGGRIYDKDFEAMTVTRYRHLDS